MLKKILLATAISCVTLAAMEVADQPQSVESLRTQIINNFQENILPFNEEIFDKKMDKIIQGLCMSPSEKELRDCYFESTNLRDDFFTTNIDLSMMQFREEKRELLRLNISKMYQDHPHYEELKMITGLELSYSLTKQYFLDKLSVELERLRLPPHTIAQVN